MRPINPAAIVLLGLFTTLWGVWVAVPWWDVFTSAAIYSALEQVFPEVVWGLIAICCGLLIIYGAVWPSYRFALVCAAVAAWHWTTISIMYFMGDWTNTGGIIMLGWGVYAAYVYLNLKMNDVYFKNQVFLKRKKL